MKHEVVCCFHLISSDFGSIQVTILWLVGLLVCFLSMTCLDLPSSPTWRNEATSRQARVPNGLSPRPRPWAYCGGAAQAMNSGLLERFRHDFATDLGPEAPFRPQFHMVLLWFGAVLFCAGQGSRPSQKRRLATRAPLPHAAHHMLAWPQDNASDLRYTDSKPI